jgi:hypothetical protein
MENFWYLFWPVGILSGHLLYIMAIWYLYVAAIRYIIPILVNCTMKNLATLFVINCYCCIARLHFFS